MHLDDVHQTLAIQTGLGCYVIQLCISIRFGTYIQHYECFKQMTSLRTLSECENSLQIQYKGKRLYKHAKRHGDNWTLCF